MTNRTEPLTLDEATKRGIVCSDEDAEDYKVIIRSVRSHDIMKYGNNIDILDERRKDQKRDLSWNAKVIPEIGAHILGPYALGGHAMIHAAAQDPISYVSSENPKKSKLKLKNELAKWGYEKYARKYDAGLKKRIRAVKKLLERKREDGLPTQRFNREAGICMGYDHPNFSHAIYADHEDYTIVSRMFLNSTSLYVLGNSRTPREKFQAGLHMWKNFVDFYNAGILHRDINPNNILLDNSSLTTRVIDFGLSSVTSVPEFTWEQMKEQQGITVADFIEATTSCVSPEVVLHTLKNHTYKSDIFSLAATFYFLLTGRNYMELTEKEDAEFGNLSRDMKMVAKIMNWANGKNDFKIIPLHEVNPSIPDFGLNELLVGQCMAVDPRDRPSSFKEVYKKLLKLEKTLSSSAMTERASNFQLPTISQRTEMISEAEIKEEERQIEERKKAERVKRRTSTRMASFEQPEVISSTERIIAQDLKIEDSSHLQEVLDEIQGPRDLFEELENLITGDPNDTQRIGDAIRENSEKTIVIPENQSGYSEKTIVIPADQPRYEKRVIPSRKSSSSLIPYTPKTLGPRSPPHKKFCRK